MLLGGSGSGRELWSFWGQNMWRLQPGSDVQKLFAIIFYDRACLGGVHDVKKSEINNKTK